MKPSKTKIPRETVLLEAKMDAARSRLKQAQVDLAEVLELLAGMPLALKTGVMRAIETAFEEVQQAEGHVAEVNEIVRVSRALEMGVTSTELPSS